MKNDNPTKAATATATATAKKEAEAEEQYFFSSNPSSNPSIFKNSILILPIVSLGNVPQLAVDLLIQSTSFNRIGSLDPSHHIPILGDPNTRPFEVYQTKDHSITILQQRSPVLKSHKEIHISRLSKWIQSQSFASILLLISIDSATRTDAHLNHPTNLFQLTYGQTDPSELRHQLLRHFSPLVDQTLSKEVPILSAGGLARRLIFELKTSNSLIIYVAEGDGRLDARILALELIKLLPKAYQSYWDESLVNADQWSLKEPESWNVTDRIQLETRAQIYG